MNRVITLIIGLLVALQPLATLASPCCGCPESVMGVEIDTPPESCCADAPDEPADTPDVPGSAGCECPKSCCASKHAGPMHVAAPLKPVASSEGPTRLASTPTGVRAEPHRLLLKRPPRDLALV